MYNEILFEIDDGVATLTLNRPQTLNALTFAMMYEVQDALTQIENDKQIRALVFTGAGRGFCSGQDLRDRLPDGSDLVQEVMDAYIRAIQMIRTSRVPVVMAINGTAAGGGCALALAGDIILAGQSAKFIQVFSRIGLIPDCGSTYLVPRAVGRARALQMMMTNDPLPAEQALEWGLINACHEDAQLLRSATELAARLAKGPTRALAAARAMVDEGEHQSFEAQCRRELEVQCDIRESFDAKEGVAAFVEKRPAAFRGE